LIKNYEICRNIQGILPPHVVDKMLDSKDAKIRKIALRTMKFDNYVRMDRISKASEIRTMRDASPVQIEEKKLIEIYDAKNAEVLPGDLVRKVGGKATGDVTTDEAFAAIDATYNVYKEKFDRNSIDDYGMKIVATVHFGEKYANAFWNGSQIVFGDGDGVIFSRFTADPDIMGHEIAHGVTQFVAGLIYRYQSGALNENYSDVFGAIVKQYMAKEKVDKADWLVGANCLIGEQYALRSMKAPGTGYVDHPQIGTDPQPATMDDYLELDPWEDNGGVHINSGIPNYAFYITAMELGGYAWEKAGVIWYKALPRLNRNSSFEEAANMMVLVASEEYGEDSAEHKATIKGWKAAKVI
jgi:Zn-dependent metalloprotease